MAASLDGKRAIVTGASSGIGAETTRMLREAGARVAGGARRVERIDADVAVELDVTDPESCKAFVESTEEDERTVLETNVNGLVRMTRLCLPHLEGGGHIVNLGSIAAITPYPGGTVYCLSKAAVHSFSQGLREDLLGKPIRITVVAGGLVQTDFSLVRFGGDEEKADAVYRNVALGGPIHAEDVADCIMFALTRAPHVNVDEVVVTALAQSSGARIVRED